MIVCPVARQARAWINTPLHHRGSGRFVEDVGADGAMVGRSEVFSVVVGEIGVAGCPEDVEVILAYAIAYPIETHIHGAGTFLFDGVISYAVGASVVCLDWCSGLRVPHGNKDSA